MTIVQSTFTGYPHGGFRPYRFLEMAELLRKQRGISVTYRLRPDTKNPSTWPGSVGCL